jgi:arylsulfatase A-like enzyme
MRRSVRLVATLMLASPLGACGGDSSPSVFPRAPVVLISIDTLRADRLPAYGYRGVRTPNLDRFRRDAILYQNAYSPCPMTLPSHLTMLTGLLPQEHGVRNNLGVVFNGEAHASLPLLLKGQGYATGAAVSSYVLRAETGLAGVFDYYEDSIDPRPGAPPS